MSDERPEHRPGLPPHFPSLARRRADFAALGLLAAFSLLFFRQVAFFDLIIVDYDVFTYFYPQQEYLASRLMQGELPLWNPYLFAGAPFLANIQTGVFYPLNLLFLLFSVPRAYVYSMVLHVYLAGAFAYAFGRRGLGLGVTASLATALIFAFGGFFSALATHLNQLQAAAWLPALFLLFGEAWRSRRWGWGALAGVALCLQVLAGHTQVLYLTAAGLALYLVGDLLLRLWEARTALRRGVPSPQPGRWAAFLDICRERAGALGPLLVGLVLGVGLAAAQLLPTLELAGLSIRASGLTYNEASSFSFPPWMLLKGLLPLYFDAPPFSEYQAYAGLSGLVLAVAALATRQRHRQAWLFAGLALVAFVLALGQFDPLYPRLYRYLPGLKLFRVPARWLFLYSFALAALAGMGLEALRKRGLHWRRLALFLGTLLLPLVAYALLRPPYPLQLPSEGTMGLWGVFSLAALALLGLSARQPSRQPSPRGRGGQRGEASCPLSLWERVGVRFVLTTPKMAPAALVLLLAGELLWASQAQVANRPSLPEAYSSQRPAVSHLLTEKGLYRTLALSDNSFDPGDLPQMRAYLADVLSPQQIADYVTYTKHKETLTPNLPLRYGIPSLDGYDGGLLPLRSYVDLKSLFALETESTDGRLREQVSLAPPPWLLGWLNVKHLLMDRVHDVWVDGVYYDLGIRRALSSAEDNRLDLAHLPPVSATAVGIISSLNGATDLPQGLEVATLEVTDSSGARHAFPLRAGVEVAEAHYDQGMRRQPLAHQKARAVATWVDDPSAQSYYALLRLPEPASLVRLTVISHLPAARFVVQGISLVDEPGELSEPVPLYDELRLAHVGDVKIYENTAARPRAWLASRISLADSPVDALTALKELSRPSGAGAVVLRSEWPSGQPLSGGQGTVAVVDYRPEQVRLRVRLEQPGLLVLTDTYYPGWTVRVDGQEQPILHANYLFRGVTLPAGEHIVEFAFVPSSLRLGAVISLASLLALAACIGWLIVARSRCIIRRDRPRRA